MDVVRDHPGHQSRTLVLLAAPIKMSIDIAMEVQAICTRVKLWPPYNPFWECFKSHFATVVCNCCTVKLK